MNIPIEVDLLQEYWTYMFYFYLEMHLSYLHFMLYCNYLFIFPTILQTSHLTDRDDISSIFVPLMPGIIIGV